MTRLVSFGPGDVLTVEGRGQAAMRKGNLALVRALLEAGGRTLSNEALASVACNHGDPSRVVRVMVCKVRSALREIGCGGMIRTDWGGGYYIEPAAYRLDASDEHTITLTLPPAMMDALAREAEDGDLEQTALALLGEALEASE